MEDLFQAAIARDVTRQIIFHGADPNGLNEEGDAPLHAALKRRAPLAVIAELVRLGARVNTPNAMLHTPLFLAVCNDIKVLEHLLDVGAVPNSPVGMLSPLHAAVFNNYSEHVDVLLAHGADPQHRGPRGATPLFAARSRQMAQRLIEAGANPHYRNCFGLNAIEWWLERGQDDLVQSLTPPRQRPALRLIGGSGG